MSDIYLSLTETPAVVTLSQPVISGALAATVTVGNTVTVALDANSLSALEQVTVTVGAAVSVSNFPATQVVSVGNFPASQVVTGTVALDSASLIALENVTVTVGAAVTVAGFSTSSLPPSTVTVGNSVTIGNFPSTQTIAGTVTANVSGDVIDPMEDYNVATQKVAVQIYGAAGTPIGGPDSDSLPISGTVTANAFGTDTSGNSVRIPVAESSCGNTSNWGVPITWNDANDGPDIRVAGDLYPLPVKVSSGTVTVSGLPAISGTVTANVELFADTTQFGSSVFGVSGIDVNAVRTVIYSSANSGFTDDAGAPVDFNNPLPVTLKQRPTWTDYSGSVVTANSAVTAISTGDRSYLLVQVTTGQMFLNIGATCTTGNGVYFSAGQGFAWETSVPQGIVSIISGVTGTNYVLKDG